MNHWETTERFDAVVLNNCLSYAVDPPQMFERTLGWLTEDGFVVVAMYRGLGAVLHLVSDQFRLRRTGGCLRGEG